VLKTCANSSHKRTHINLEVKSYKSQEAAKPTSQNNPKIKTRKATKATKAEKPQKPRSQSGKKQLPFYSAQISQILK